MTDLETLDPADARRIEESMRVVAARGPIGFHILTTLIPYIRKGVRAGDPYRTAIRERFLLVTGHDWPADGKPPPLH